MDEWTAFVRARLDEDEAAAQAAVDSAHRDKCAKWIARPDGDGYVIGDEAGHFAFCLAGASEGGMRHVIRHDPARALREVEAGRAIVRRYERESGSGLPGRRVALDVLIGPLRDLAAVWGDHPDYPGRVTATCARR